MNKQINEQIIKQINKQIYLPGLVRAESRLSNRFVAAITITPSLVWNPSISANNWLIVWLAYGLPEFILLPVSLIISLVKLC